MKSASSRSRSSVDAAWITPRTLPLDRPALALPARHAAVHHVDHVARAEALEDARGDGRPLPRRADDGDRPAAVEPVRQLVDVVVGGVDGAWDVPPVPLRALADVEQLRAVRTAVPAAVELLQAETLDTLDGLLLLAPRGHAARQVSCDVGEADCARQL